MSKPITTPFTFQAQAGPIPLSQLDSDFATAAAAINDFATYSNYLTDTSGAPNQITVTIPVGTTFSYSAGVKLEVLLGNTTTSTAVQINVNGLGNKAVQNIDGSVPAVGQLIAGMILQLQYNGTVFLLVGAGSKSASGIAPFTAGGGGNVNLPAPSSGVALTLNGFAGSSALQVLGTGVQLGAPTGGDQGLGTLNATGVFLSGVNSVQTGTFTGTLTGCTTAPTTSFGYSIVNGTIANIYCVSGGFIATSSAVTCTITGLPSVLNPAGGGIGGGSCVVGVEDNGAFQIGTASVFGNTISLAKGIASAAGGFTAAGAKGIPNGFSMTYALK